MPSPFPQAKKGKPVNDHPTGFPVFFDKRRPRVITADPWAYLAHIAVSRLPKAEERIALAYLEQGRDFFEAASNPRLGSKPLLYYYSFLNLAKAALLIRKVRLAANARHGIADPRANTRTRLRFQGQTVKTEALARDHSEVFPELVKMLDGSASARTYRVIELLGQVPSVHRTWTQVTGQGSQFIPVRRFYALHHAGQVWARVVLKKVDRDVSGSLTTLRSRQAFRRVLHQVVPDDSSEVWFETDPAPGVRRGVDTGIAHLASALASIGLATVMTRDGHLMYLSTVSPAQRLPSLAAAYAVVFYLGSVVRYKPDVFDKIVAGAHSWLVADFLATQPTQFTYTLASYLGGVDVVRPFASPH